MAQPLHEAVAARTQKVSGLIDQMQAPLDVTSAELAKSHTWLDRARRFHRIPFLGGFAVSRAKVHQDRAGTAQGQLEPLITQALNVYQPNEQ